MDNTRLSVTRFKTLLWYGTLVSPLTSCIASATSQYMLPELDYVQTDGIGGHVQRAVEFIGIAKIYNLQVICNPWLLYNGHHADDPYFSSSLFGCNENGTGVGSFASAEVATHENTKKYNGTLCNLPQLIQYHARDHAAHVYPVVYIVRKCEGTALMLTNRLWPYAAAFFREQFFSASTQVDSIARTVWGGDTNRPDARKFRIAIHWRTGLWSVHSRCGIQLADLVRIRLKDLDISSSQADVRFVVAWKEDDAAIAIARNQMELLKREFFPKARILESTQERGVSSTSDLLRDLATLATSDLLFVSTSQFSQLATALQHEGGSHVLCVKNDHNHDEQHLLLSNTIAYAATPKIHRVTKVEDSSMTVAELERRLADSAERVGHGQRRLHQNKEKRKSPRTVGEGCLQNFDCLF